MDLGFQDDESRYSLLHWAADRGCAPAVRYLLSLSTAEIALLNVARETPLALAQRRLTQHGAGVKSDDSDYGACATLLLHAGEAAEAGARLSAAADASFQAQATAASRAADLLLAELGAEADAEAKNKAKSAAKAAVQAVKAAAKAAAKAATKAVQKVGPAASKPGPQPVPHSAPSEPPPAPPPAQARTRGTCAELGAAARNH